MVLVAVFSELNEWFTQGVQQEYLLMPEATVRPVCQTCCGMVLAKGPEQQFDLCVRHVVERSWPLFNSSYVNPLVLDAADGTRGGGESLVLWLVC